MNIISKKFSKLNKKRSNQIFPACKSWGPRDWAIAIAEEAGEICGEVKRVGRGSKKEIDKEAMGKEIADVFTYLDLLVDNLGLNWDEIIKQKFNEVSEKRGSELRIE